MRSTAVLALGSLLALGGCGSESSSHPRDIAAPMEVAGAPSEAATLEVAAAPEAAGRGVQAQVDRSIIYEGDGDLIRASEIERHFPEAFTKWQAAVNALHADLIYWVRLLDGQDKSLTWVNVSGQPLIKGYVCEMHACGMNEVVYLMRPDQSRIVGIAKLDEDNSQRTEYLIGNPTPNEARCLRFYLANEDNDSDC